MTVRKDMLVFVTLSVWLYIVNVATSHIITRVRFPWVLPGRAFMTIELFWEAPLLGR